MDKKKYIKNLFNLSILIVILLISYKLRKKFIDYRSVDYNAFLAKWWDFIKNNGGFHALKYNFADYTPPYLYILLLGTHLTNNSLHFIKYLDFIFEVMTSVLIMLIIYKKYKNNKLALFAFGCTLFIPTVIFNGFLWGQCDIIFTFFIVASIFSITNNKKILSIVFYAIALSFKIQAIFLLPLYGVLLFKKRLHIFHFFIIPIVYTLLMIPAAIAGRPLIDLFLIYVKQGQAYPDLTFSAPNIYQWYTSNLPMPQETIAKYGILITFLVVISIFFIAIRYIKVLSDENIVELSFIFALIVPFLLPHMHERYFFTADVFSLVYAFYFPKRYYMALIVPLASLFSYYPFLLGSNPIPIPLLSLFMLIALSSSIYDFMKNIVSKDTCSDN